MIVGEGVAFIDLYAKVGANAESHILKKIVKVIGVPIAATSEVVPIIETGE